MQGVGTGNDKQETVTGPKKLVEWSRLISTGRIR